VSPDAGRRGSHREVAIDDRQRVLILCTGNSCRSQMAEGWIRYLRGDEFEPFSAGISPSRVDPRAIAVMAEAGVDISGHRSKSVDDFPGQEFDWVVTVCDSAREQCPFFPGGTKRVHVGFADPPHLAANAASEDEAMEHYRRVRDEIRKFVEAMPVSLERDEPA
jgi:arsenate reductase